MAQEISRRQFAHLIVLALAGAGIGHLLRRSGAVGRDIRSHEAAQAALRDRTSPSFEVDQPTLTLVLFTDYRCPACKLANRAMEMALARDKHVRVVYRDWPIFGPMSEQAARVAIASDRQGIYPLVHARLMHERRAMDENILRQAVEASGGEWKQIETDLQTYAADIDLQLDRNRADAFQLSVTGTPTYLAGPILVAGAQDEAAFGRLFAEAREAQNAEG